MEKYFMAAMGGADGFGNKSIELLVKHFGTAKAVWSATTADLLNSSVKRKYLDLFIAWRKTHPDAPEKLISYCDRQKINLCCITDPDYPPILKQIRTAPMFFYYRGKLEPLAERIGIVGTRENTSYGKGVALELGENLAAAGLTVVSGAARGIDTFAHRGALKSGRTVAVLGCGINYIFPRENKKLYEQIAERGVVMSEFPPQLTPNPGTFPARNRIIAGLCRGIIVVEAGKKSGALITSDYAADFGRDVFSIPGQIYSDKSVGCNELIREGATLIKSAADVLSEYNIVARENKIKPENKTVKAVELDGTAAKILELIPFDKYITDDEILMQIDEINPSELSNIMVDLEIKGCIVDEFGRYKRKVGG